MAESVCLRLCLLKEQMPGQRADFLTTHSDVPRLCAQVDRLGPEHIGGAYIAVGVLQKQVYSINSLLGEAQSET